MGLSNISHKPLSKDEIKAKATSILQENLIKVIETPYDKIDWSDLMRRAVEHIQPFEKTHDKGIKDGVFAQTIKEYYKRHRAKRNVRFVIISHDILLKEYMKEICPGSRVSVHDSIDDFKSVLKLAIEDKKADLLTKAKGAFYTLNNKSSVYWTANLPDKMNRLYAKLVGKTPSEHILKITGEQFIGNTQIPSDEIWTPLDKKYAIKSTHFISRREGRFKWMTVLTLKQAYGLTTSKNQYGVPINNPASVIHTVMYTVGWSCSLDARGNIEKQTVDDVKVLDELVSVNPYGGIDWDNLNSSLTLPPSPPLTGLAKIQESLSALGTIPSGSYQKAFEALQLQPFTGMQEAISKITQPRVDLANAIVKANEASSIARQELLGMKLSKAKPEKKE